MAGGKPFGPEVVTLSFRQVFLYFESAIYLRFDLPVRRFLLELASFETFDLEMARMVSGNPHAGEMLDWLQRNTTMLRYDGIQQFYFWPQFRRFLLWEMEREYSEEKRRAMFNRGGMYYELKEDYPRALACYTKGGDHTKVSDLLIRNAELHPGMGHYQEMEKYYRALSEEEILAHPSLMQGMSMLCALSMDYEGSERWYDEPRKYAERCGRQDAAGKRARSRPKAEIFYESGGERGYIRRSKCGQITQVAVADSIKLFPAVDKQVIPNPDGVPAGLSGGGAVDRRVIHQGTLLRTLMEHLGGMEVHGRVPFFQPCLHRGQHPQKELRQVVVVQGGAAQLRHTGGKQSHRLSLMMQLQKKLAGSGLQGELVPIEISGQL